MFDPADRIKHIKLSTIRNLFDRGHDCINLGLGEPAFFSPPVIRREAARVVMEERLPYTINYGLPELRSRILKHFYGNDDLERLMLTAGSQEALFATVLAFINPGDEIMIPDPAFSPIPRWRASQAPSLSPTDCAARALGGIAMPSSERSLPARAWS